ncbi:MAG: ROK family protein [Armatimonadota bacterium]
MEFNRNAQYVIGVDLGGTNVRAAVVDRSGNIAGEGRAESRAMEGLNATVGQIVLAINTAVESSPAAMADIAGVGMGVPGTVKSEEGVVLWSPNFLGWDGIQLAAPIVAQVGVPVLMGNDANVAALGECAFGAGKGSKCMVMFTLGTGIGSGLIIDGKIWVGTNESGPEMGHQIVVADGPRCGCGRYGCLEALAQRDAIIDRAARKAHLGRRTTLLEKSDHDLRYITPAMIAEAATEGDPISIETLRETGYYIGIGVSNAINMLNPDKVVIGGGIAQAGDLLFDPIRDTVEVNALYHQLQGCEVVPAELGDNAGVLGGAAMILQRIE